MGGGEWRNARKGGHGGSVHRKFGETGRPPRTIARTASLCLQRKVTLAECKRTSQHDQRKRPNPARFSTSYKLHAFLAGTRQADHRRACLNARWNRVAQSCLGPDLVEYGPQSVQIEMLSDVAQLWTIPVTTLARLRPKSDLRFWANFGRDWPMSARIRSKRP